MKERAPMPASDKAKLKALREVVKKKGNEYICPFKWCEPKCWLTYRKWIAHMRDDHQVSIGRYYPCRKLGKCGKVFKTSKGSLDHKCEPRANPAKKPTDR